MDTSTGTFRGASSQRRLTSVDGRLRANFGTKLCKRLRGHGAKETPLEHTVDAGRGRLGAAVHCGRSS